MKWHRRDLNDFGPFDWLDRGGRMVPNLAKSPPKRPEPWKMHPRASECFKLPVAIVKEFADPNELAEDIFKDRQQILELINSIDRDGLREPVTLYYDENGKIRYHDGYHRLAAILEIDDFDYIPVILNKSPTVKGYGRPMVSQINEMFVFITQLVEEA